jgi:hypothetical protein
MAILRNPPRTMRIVHLLSFSGLLSLPLLAQTKDAVSVRFTLGDPSLAAAKYQVRDICSGDDGAFLVLKTEPPKGQSIYAVADAELKTTVDVFELSKVTFLRTQPPKITSSQGQLTVEAIERIGSKPMFIASRRSNGQQRFELYWQALHARSLRPESSFEPFGSFSYAEATKGQALQGAGTSPIGLTTLLSPDSSKVLVRTLNEGVRAEDGTWLHFFGVFDRDLKPIWHRFLPMPFKDGSSVVRSISVDNSGTVTALLRNDDKRRNVEGDKLNFGQVVFSLDSAGTKSVAVGLFGKHYATDAQLQLLADGRVACVGVYGDNQVMTSERLGIFSTFLDVAKMEWVGLEEIPFNQTREEKNYRNVELVNVLARTDGGFFVVAHPTRTHTLSNAPNTPPKYQREDLHCFALDSEGKQQWYTVFERRFEDESATSGDVLTACFKDKLFLFLVDDEPSMELRKKGLELLKWEKSKGVYSYVAFDQGGKFKSKPVLQGAAGNCYMDANEGLWPMGNNVYVAMVQGKPGKGPYYPVRVGFTAE